MSLKNKILIFFILFYLIFLCIFGIVFYTNLEKTFYDDVKQGLRATYADFYDDIIKKDYKFKYIPQKKDFALTPIIIQVYKQNKLILSTKKQIPFIKKIGFFIKKN